MASLLLTFVGVLGAVAYVAAFVLLQTGRIKGDSIAYSALNVLGAVFVLLSLFAEWSTAAFVNNVVWGLIALYGLRPRKRPVLEPETLRAAA